jgi:hypothetical protein
MPMNQQAIDIVIAGALIAASIAVTIAVMVVATADRLIG